MARNRKALYVNYREYWKHCWDACSKSVSIGKGPLGKYFCDTMLMDDVEFEERLYLNRKAPKPSRPRIDYFTYCDRICELYNYEIITDDALYSMAIHEVERFSDVDF